MKDLIPTTLRTVQAEKRGICKYTKISQMQRNQLLHQVFFCQQKIKDAAKELGINYSSAKTILHIHRKRFRFQSSKEFETSKNVCTYKPIENRSLVNPINIITSQGGKVAVEGSKLAKPFPLESILQSWNRTDNSRACPIIKSSIQPLIVKQETIPEDYSSRGRGDSQTDTQESERRPTFSEFNSNSASNSFGEQIQQLTFELNQAAQLNSLLPLLLNNPQLSQMPYCHGFSPIQFTLNDQLALMNLMCSNPLPNSLCFPFKA